jgi:serine/threonine protein kinase
MENDCSNEIIGKIFFKKYKVTKKLGQGSFGQVFKGINTTNNEDIAFKFVKIKKIKKNC